RAEEEDSGQHISREEVVSQLHTLLITSYETTASTHYMGVTRTRMAPERPK
ncbi:hypothetical protein PISMIDRAFT_649329, partial [Pisolithus microcarpus 441]